MKSENVLLTAAIVTLVFSVLSVGIVYSSINDFKNSWLTGFSLVTTATVNLTVETAGDINFTTNNINFGSGKITPPFQNATLITTGSGSVVGGNFTTVSHGFVLQNIGNVNVTLNLTSGKTAATFLGGTSPVYQFNVTINTSTGNSSAVCTNSTGNPEANLSVWRDLLATPQPLCANFSFIDGSDALRIDLKLAVPYDSKVNALGDIITVNGY